MSKKIASTSSYVPNVAKYFWWIRFGMSKNVSMDDILEHFKKLSRYHLNIMLSLLMCKTLPRNTLFASSKNFQKISSSFAFQMPFFRFCAIQQRLTMTSWNNFQNYIIYASSLWSFLTDTKTLLEEFPEKLQQSCILFYQRPLGRFFKIHMMLFRLNLTYQFNLIQGFNRCHFGIFKQFHNLLHDLCVMFSNW